MAVLLMCLAGPMQSWGTQSRFSNRDTGLEPSKSGVIGLLCAALGKPRDERERTDLPTLRQLDDLKMGVRVDREGVVQRDYHTAQHVAKAGGGTKDCELSERYYLADAAFLVGFEGDANLLKQLDEALAKPVWQLFLGRKAFVPGLPVKLKDGLKPDISLAEALKNYLCLCHGWRSSVPPESLRLEIEVEYGQGEMVKHDQPECFIQGHRLFGLRHVKRGEVRLKDLPSPREDELCTFLA